MEHADVTIVLVFKAICLMLSEILAYLNRRLENFVAQSRRRECSPQCLSDQPLFLTPNELHQ
jgi:hypothetical protein